MVIFHSYSIEKMNVYFSVAGKLISECFKIFTDCLGWGFLANITCMQLLTQICQVLLTADFKAREAACI